MSEDKKQLAGEWRRHVVRETGWNLKLGVCARTVLHGIIKVGLGLLMKEQKLESLVWGRGRGKGKGKGSNPR